MNKNVLAIGVIFFLVVSSIPPIVFGYNVRTLNKETLVENYNFDRYLYPEYYDCYNADEIPDFIEQPNNDTPTDYSCNDPVVINQKELAQSLAGPMDSPWPMYCHDTHHTGRSPYSTADNKGFKKWQFSTGGTALGSPVVDDQGVIYIGTTDFYAVYPNGTLKWKYDIPFQIESAPAIDENGVIYIGTIWDAINGDHLYALYPNGTLKWKYHVGDNIASSPVIDNDGTIYFGSESDYIYALYPNGTLKWKYLTSIAVYSDPAIGDDGTVYCGSHDGNLYALYPNNGTLKWKYQTGDWVARGPSIADDGTIYFGSWDGYLYAVYPDGTLKWKTDGNLAGTTPVTAQDGTIYVGNRYLSAIYPINGSIKWMFDPGPDRLIQGGNPCISAEGTIYFGTSDGGEIIAVNSDGTERWRKYIGAVHSAPAIGSDGTVYVEAGWDTAYLYAFGPPDPNAPETPTINGPTNGKVRTSYDYTFTTIDPNGDDVFYYITWGDGKSSGWLGPFGSGEVVIISHAWAKKGTYIIQAQAKDTNDLESDWGALTIKMPKNKTFNIDSLFLKLMEKFPLLERLLTCLY